MLTDRHRSVLRSVIAANQQLQVQQQQQQQQGPSGGMLTRLKWALLDALSLAALVGSVRFLLLELGELGLGLGPLERGAAGNNKLTLSQ
jgi:hypothetical protein